jgi:hypothetical protein
MISLKQIDKTITSMLLGALAFCMLGLPATIFGTILGFIISLPSRK